MKLAQPPRADTRSATISQTLWLMLACSALLMISAYATAPGWWASSHATNGYTRQDSAVVNQGQLKQFTTRAAYYLTTNFPAGAGSNLNTMVSNWISNYTPNNPSDYQAVNVGQLKYIANIVWSQLVVGGYTNEVPLWISTNSTDYNLATIGQLKTVFNFDLTNFASVPQMTSPTTASGLAGTAFNYTYTASNVPTSMDVTGLPPELSVSDTTVGGNLAEVISGTPETPSVYTLSLSASNSSGTGYGTVTISITPPAPMITSATSATSTVGSVFDYTITANNSPTSFSSPSLPTNGIAFVDVAAGAISGIPTTSGTYTIVLDATNAGGTGTTNLVVNVSNPSAPVITSLTTAEGTVGYAFTYTLTASNSPTNWSASGLPLNLSFDPGSGVISGTPETMTAGTYTIPLSASNAGGTDSANLTLTIHSSGTPVIPPLTEYAFTTTAFSYTYTVSASSTPTFSVSAGSLPSGLSISSGGVISGTPTDASTYTVSSTISASNGSGTGSGPLEFIMNLPVPTITSSLNVTAPIGQSFYYAMEASDSPTNYAASGLPAGLSIDPITGVIAGTPLVATTMTGTPVTLSAMNQGGTGTTNMVLTIDPPPLPVPVITSGRNVTAAEGVAFSYTITASSVDTPTFTNAGTLPLGLTLDSTSGVISGIPTVTTTGTSITLYATNSAGTGSATLFLKILSSSAPVITSASTAYGITGDTFSYTITATNSPTSFGATGLPAGLSLNTSTGVIMGTLSGVGISTVTLNATKGSETAISTLTLTISPPLPTISSPGTVSGTFGVPFPSYTIVANNNPTGSDLPGVTYPTPFYATGLPPGLILDDYTGLIVGTPIASGTFTATLYATNEGGSGTKSLVFTINDWTSSLPNIGRSIANGDRHSLMLKTDGSVWAVGDDYYGELGDSNNTDTSSYGPVSTVTGFTGIIAVAAGGVTSLALDSAGHVWAWGGNGNGQLGNGTTTNSNFPVEVVTSFGGSPLSNIVAIASGHDFSMALDSTGHVWTWGINSVGTLGNGTNTDSSVPVEVTISPGVYLSGIVAISGGDAQAVALDNSGHVWTWGSDYDDQLGDGISMNSNVPIEVPDFDGITAIASGANYSLALKNDGTVWAWGYNGDGELGNGMTGSDKDTPAQVMGLSDITAINCGYDHILALKSDGTVWAWGNNTSYGLANGTTTGNSSIPNQISNLTGVIVLGAGYAQNTVLKNDGTIWGWGQDTWGVTLPIEVGDRETAALPTFSPAAGVHTGTITISTTITTPGASIHYTLDGTEPTANSPMGTSVSLNGSALVSAAVFVNGVMVSPVASAQYYDSTTDPSSTGDPTTVTISSANAVSSNEIDLSWSLGGQFNYNTIYIYRSDGGAYHLIAVLPSSATSYKDMNAVSGVAYTYEVGTVNSSGESDSTASSSATPATPTSLNIYITTPSSGVTPL